MNDFRYLRVATIAALATFALSGAFSGAGRPAMVFGSRVADTACSGVGEIRDPWPEFIAPGLYAGPVGFVQAHTEFEWTVEVPYQKLLLAVDAAPGTRLRIEGYASDGRRLRFSHGRDDGAAVETIDTQVPDRNHPSGLPQDLPGLVEFPGPGCYYTWVSLDNDTFGPIGLRAN